MKIALIMGSVSRLAGGLLEANRRLAQGWHERGDEVLVLGVRDRFTEQDRQLWAPLIPVVFSSLGPARLGYAPGLKAALAEFSPDVVHSQGMWTYPSWVAARWKQASTRGEVIHPHGMLDSWALKNSARKKRVMTTLFERSHVKRASCVRALCVAELESIRAYGYQGPVCVIPNGIDLPLRPTGDEIHPKLPVGKKVLLYLGRLHPKKGLANLIQAWAKVSDRRGWVLAIAGWDDGHHEESLKLLTQERALHEDVLFLGPQFGSEKEQLYRSCEAFVLPSYSEGLPMVVLEAWAYAKPVLMTPMCNLPEGFVKGAALPVQPQVDSLVIALAQMVSLTTEERERMGRAGCRLVQEQFSWQRVVQDLSDVNRWLVDGAAVPSCVALSLSGDNGSAVLSHLL